MATVIFSVPDDVKEAFNRAFAGKNESAIVAELMREAVWSAPNGSNAAGRPVRAPGSGGGMRRRAVAMSWRRHARRAAPERPWLLMPASQRGSRDRAALREQSARNPAPTARFADILAQLGQGPTHGLEHTPKPLQQPELLGSQLILYLITDPLRHTDVTPNRAAPTPPAMEARMSVLASRVRQYAIASSKRIASGAIHSAGPPVTRVLADFVVPGGSLQVREHSSERC